MGIEKRMINIIGAGMAGLLAANMLKQKHDVTIYEKQNALPNNHSAILRFRSSIVGDVLGIPFQKVTMVKASAPWRNPIADSLAYTDKCTGILRSDRSMPTNPVTEERYIAPPDLISRMAKNMIFRFGEEIQAEELRLNGSLRNYAPIISTMPMPALMKLLEYEHSPSVQFNYTRGVNIRATISNCDAYVSLYIPDPFVEFSRISLSGNEMIVEVQDPYATYLDDASDEHGHLRERTEAAAYHLGIAPERIHNIYASKQKYSKILPINDDVRKDFIYWATDKFHVFSLGRYATWRPRLLLDDLVNDVRKISSWIDRNNRYEAAKAR